MHLNAVDLPVHCVTSCPMPCPALGEFDITFILLVFLGIMSLFFIQKFRRSRHALVAFHICLMSLMIRILSSIAFRYHYSYTPHFTMRSICSKGMIDLTILISLKHNAAITV